MLSKLLIKKKPKTNIKLSKEDTNKIIKHNGIKKEKVNSASSPGDNIYFNVVINSDFLASVTLSNYAVIRTRSIVERASDYYLSVLRFNIPAYYTPLGYFVTLPGDTQKGVYSITMEQGDINPEIGTQTHLLFGEVSGINTYFKPIQTTEDGSFLYYIYKYDRIVKALNDALLTAYIEISEDSEPKHGDYPYMIYNSATKLFEMYYPDTFLSEVPGINYNLYFNEYLWEFFNSFPATSKNDTTGFQPDGRDWKMNIRYLGDNYITTKVPSLMPEVDFEEKLFYVMKQEYITLFNWNPFSKIILTTSLLPVRDEYVKGDGDSFLKILTDFIPTNDVVEIRTTFQYFSQGQYRLVDLISDGDIRDIDIGIFWEDKLGNLNPLYLQPGATVNLKLGFFSKEIYHNNHLKNFVML